ncbi:MAG: hypothetical protein QXG65_06525 [Thermoplasmata archaeon]
MAPPDPVAERIGPAENGRRDAEALGSGRPSVRTAVLDRTALSIGVGVREEAPMVRRARDLGVPVLRRSTGGTGILHGPGDVVWSVVLPRGDPRIGPDRAAAFGRLGAGAVDWLAGYGVASAWIPSPSRSPECCPLGGRGRVLAIADGGRVLSGAAQHLAAGALLHHAAVPRRIDRELCRAIFAFDTPAGPEELVGTDDLGIDRTPEAIAQEIAAAIGRRLGLPRPPTGPAP